MAQPPLPDDVDWEWADATRQWWRAWGEDPRTADCSDADWGFLLEAAILHTSIWDDHEFVNISSLRAHELAFMSRLDKGREASAQHAPPVVPAESPAVTMMDKYRKRRTG
ncbi:phage terminase small subunit [Acidipropionibacterium timonense]|uniref:phage terminase small subunit n=1 Tax=Acidipropionibacterium timonense TaxID=2161818 RepID=UPI00103135F4|nr:hypothetical protein [Acidipropionibacterium timonense]